MEQIYVKLMNEFNNKYGVCALMGNLKAESNFKANNLQNSYESKLGFTDATYTAAVDSNTYTNFVRDSAGYGLAQWTYWSRKQNLLNYAKKVGKSIGDKDMQVDFLIEELKTGYKGVYNAIKNATSIRECSDIVLKQFERPADQSEAACKRRAGYGEEVYAQVTKTPVEPDKGSTMTITAKVTITTKNGKTSISIEEV